MKSFSKRFSGIAICISSVAKNVFCKRYLNKTNSLKSCVGTGQDVPSDLLGVVLTSVTGNVPLHSICSRWWVLVFINSHLLPKRQSS